MNPNESAFSKDEFHDDAYGNPHTHTTVYGLTKREHFACEAMKALRTNKYGMDKSSEEIAELSIFQADCLIKELNK